MSEIKAGSKVRVARAYGNLAPGPFGMSAGRIQSWGVVGVFADGMARITYGAATAHCPVSHLELVDDVDDSFAGKMYDRSCDDDNS